MSKGMSNLIKLTNVANKHYSTIIYHTGINEHIKHVTFSNDKDCMPCEITSYRLSEFVSMSDFWAKVDQIESIGYEVCVNTSNMFYETGMDRVECHVK